MSAVLPDGRPVRIVIQRLRIRGTSSIDARRLADGIAPALERALYDAATVRGGPARPADMAAAAIAAAIADRLAGGKAAS